MSSGSHLTIKDYFDRLNAGRNGIRKDAFSSAVNSKRTQQFNQIFESFRQQPSNKAESSSTGLTAADYIANPIRKKYQYKNPAKFVPPESAAQKAHPSTDGPALPGIDASTAKTVSASRSKQLRGETARFSGPESSRGQSDLQARERIEKSVQAAAEKYNLPPALIKGVIKAESNFQITAVSGAGARGLMQLMPLTARELEISNPFNIEQNIDGGSRYLRKMLDSFGGDVKLALAAYNAGPGAVEKYGGEIPPYQETRRYIQRVLRFSKQTV